MLDSVEKCSEPRRVREKRIATLRLSQFRNTSFEKCSEPRRVGEKRVATLRLSQFRDASVASGAIRTGSSPAEGDKRGLDGTEQNIMSSEPTAGDKRRVPDAGGFHTDEDEIEASSNLHTRPRRLLQDLVLDWAMLEEKIAPFMSFPSLREILTGNSETNGLAQSVSLTKPALKKNSYNRVGGNRPRSIQPIASVGSVFTMWEPRKRHIPSDEELIANLARCAAPTGVRLTAITAGARGAAVFLRVDPEHLHACSQKPTLHFF